MIPPIALVLSAALAAVQPASPERGGDEARAKTPSTLVTRAQLANYYLAVDGAFRDRMMNEGALAEDVVRFNKRFDAVTLDFFGANLAKAVENLIGLERDLNGAEPLPSLCGGLSVRVEPPVWFPGRPMPKVVVKGLRSASVAQARKFEFRVEATTFDLRPGAASASGEATPVTIAGAKVIDVAPGASIGIELVLDWKFPTDAASIATLKPATYDVRVRVGGVTDCGLSRLIVAPRSLSAARVDLARQLDAVADSDELRTPIQIARRRIDLLSDTPSEMSSSQFQADFTRLPEDLRDEVAALAKGKNPYRRWVGDLWRPIIIDANTSIPCRTYAPTAAAGDTPLPVVVALHGAGGDESMFLDAYAGGLITDLADREGFIVACPATMAFAADAAHFDRLLDQLAADYAVDRSHVFVLGHSMGAGAASSLARTRADALAGAVCIAGGRFAEKGEPKLAPTLVIAGELDPIAKPDALQKGAEAAKARGLPVEFVSTPNFGHTFVVGAKLADAVDWMLKQPRAGKK